MLIVLMGEEGRWPLVKHLVSNHRFIGRNTLPRSPLSPLARVVVTLDMPRSEREAQTLARRTRKLGGLLVWLDPSVRGVEVRLPDPVPFDQTEKSPQRMEMAIRAMEDLLALLSNRG